MKKAFIFDLDGTAADTLDGITHFVGRATAAFGLSSVSREKVCYYAGDGAKKLIERVLNDVGGMEHYEELFSYYNKLYNAAPFHALRTFDGMLETLKELKEKGIKLAIFSNKPHAAVAPISAYLFGDLMDVTVGQKEGIPVKPDPAGLVPLWQQLGVKPEECVYVGDTDTDMKTGKNGNMLTVGVLWGFRDRDELEQNGADAIISHPTELLKFID